jgi:hypothetical protein
MLAMSRYVITSMKKTLTYYASFLNPAGVSQISSENFQRLSEIPEYWYLFLSETLLQLHWWFSIKSAETRERFQMSSLRKNVNMSVTTK